MNTHFDRVLSEVTRGAIAMQTEEGGYKMTILMNRDDGGLIGSAFVTLRPVVAFVEGERWRPVFGGALSLPGGTELVVDEEDTRAAIDAAAPEVLSNKSMILCSVADPYLPSDLRLRVQLRDLAAACEIGTPGDGPRVNAEPRACDLHETIDFRCPACVRRWWIEKAAEVEA